MHERREGRRRRRARREPARRLGRIRLIGNIARRIYLGGVELRDPDAVAGTGEKAVRFYFDLVDQADGKTTTPVEVKAGPLGDLSEVPTEELERRLAELRARLELPEKKG